MDQQLMLGTIHPIGNIMTWNIVSLIKIEIEETMIIDIYEPPEVN